MKILYISYVDLDRASSGSSVRPQKILAALEAAGHELTSLSGEQNNFRTRTRSVRRTLQLVKKVDFDLCYVELPSGPIFNPLDIHLLKELSSRKVPISCFYRDAYWLMSPNWLDVSKIKKYIIRLMHKRDIKVLQQIADCLFVPSNLMKKRLLDYYKFSCVEALPPGTDLRQSVKNQQTGQAIYVGSAQEFYGITDLIAAYDLLHKQGYPYRLTIVCRENEFNKTFPQGLAYPWLTVAHVSGSDLEPYYATADLAILPQRKSPYMDMAFGVKLFEYLSYAKPVIVNDLVEMGGFVRKYHCGLVYHETIEALATAIHEFYQSEQQALCWEGLKKAREENSWAQRVDQIVNCTLYSAKAE